MHNCKVCVRCTVPAPGLPNQQHRPIHLRRIECLGVEVVPRPFQHIFMFRVRRVFDCLRQFRVAIRPAAVLGRARALARDAARVAYGGVGYTVVVLSHDEYMAPLIIRHSRENGNDSKGIFRGALNATYLLVSDWLLLPATGEGGDGARHTAFSHFNSFLRAAGEGGDGGDANGEDTPIPTFPHVHGGRSHRKRQSRDRAHKFQAE